MKALRHLGWRLMRFFLFGCDAESAHRLTMRLIRSSIYFKNIPFRVLVGSARTSVESKSTILGMEFRSRVGLAAGFDKDAEILAALPSLGFGFAEIGTVTPRAQPGNDRPRLFRDVERQSLFNRMGFNGLGASLVSERLARIKPQLPETFRIGVNIGKNKDTSLDEAADDYVKAVRPFRDLADYIVINVSSPNTPGLRSLQNERSLDPIVQKVGEELSKWPKKPPLLLKIAPELTEVTLSGIVRAAEAAGIDGWVLTNTLGGQIETRKGTLTGGWSGGAVTSGARRSLQEVRSFSRLPIISVGGILSLEEAKLRIQMGADLVQIYSGWIFRGPSFPRELSENL
jgi:dihydroorotate dehydrogenase